VEIFIWQAIVRRGCISIRPLFYFGRLRAFLQIPQLFNLIPFRFTSVVMVWFIDAVLILTP